MKAHPTYKDYEELCALIWKHNQHYYTDHKPVISDEEFDKLYRHLQEIENAHPDSDFAQFPHAARHGSSHRRF